MTGQQCVCAIAQGYSDDQSDGVAMLSVDVRGRKVDASRPAFEDDEGKGKTKKKKKRKERKERKEKKEKEEEEKKKQEEKRRRSEI